jgi:inositol hexakisphosphate/diphosphoinositol-pentakisphosphate kinase
MEPSLTRTASVESTRSWQQLMAGSSPADRKARSSEPETGGDIVGRASVSLPPSGSQAIRQIPQRRASKASDSIFDFFGHARNSNSNSGSAIEETETTPTLEGTRASLAPVNALLLPDAFRPPRPQPDVDAAENKRLSFSSLYSIGSAIYANTRGHSWSGRSSLAGSESEGTLRRFVLAMDVLTLPQS